MAVKKSNTELDPETIIEVIAKKDGKVFKKEMTYKKALKLDKKKGYTYEFYQLGYSQYNL